MQLQQQQHKERVANPIFEWNPLSNQVGNKCMPLDYFDFDFGIWFDYSGYLFETAFRENAPW